LTSNVSAKWPGSRLTADYPTDRYLFRCVDPLIEAMSTLAGGIYDWDNPDVLDDPHFLRQDGPTWFGSTVHERWAWLGLSAQEFSLLDEEAPALTSLLVPDA
jgi:hypothetical protein